MTSPSSSNLSTRRDALAVSAGVATAALTGCLSQPASPETDTPPKNTDSSQSAVWPQFSGNAQNTGYLPGATGPEKDPTVEWKHEVGTPTMHTSPVVGDRIVYVPGSGNPGLVHAVSLETGEQRWEFEPAGWTSCTPALVDGTLYFGTSGRRFYALDAKTGSPRWSKRIGQRLGSSSPAVVDGTVYVGTSGDGPLTASGPEDTENQEAPSFLALDAASGDVEWEYREFDERTLIDSSPAVAGGRVYFGAEDRLYALDADSGSEVWTQNIPTRRNASPVVSGGVVYFGTLVTGNDEMLSQMWALDAATGEQLWTAGIDDNHLGTSPAVAEGTVYVAASSTRRCANSCSGVTRGRLYALDTASGDRKWMTEIKPDVRSSPAVANGLVYVGCGNGMSAVTTDGENAWRVNFGSLPLIGERVTVESSPAVAKGRVFIGASDSRLRSITASSVV